MFQYGRRGLLLATSFYKNFVIRKEGQNGIDFEEVGISQQQKGVLFQSFINFHYLVRSSIDRNSMKIALVVFVYELINYLRDYYSLYLVT